MKVAQEAAVTEGHKEAWFQGASVRWGGAHCESAVKQRRLQRRQGGLKMNVRMKDCNG